MSGLSRHVWLVGQVESTRRALLGETVQAVHAGQCGGAGGFGWLGGVLGRAHDGSGPADQLRRSGALVLDCRPAPGDASGQAPGCSALVRHIVPWMLVNDPAGVRRNNLTVYVLASDLFARADEDPPPSSLERDMSRGELLRLANGLSELLFAWGGNGAATVVFEHAEAVDGVDQALIAELVRLMPAELVRLAVCSTTVHVPQALRAALIAGAQRRDVVIPTAEPTAGRECV